MPVVEVSYRRLAGMLGGARKRQIADALPFLGMDIESEDGDSVRVEYSPNRPDYSTDVGIAAGLAGLLGRRTGAIQLKVKRSKRYRIAVDQKVSKIRPFVVCIAARGGCADDYVIRQLMSMQEDLHMGLGRGRKKSSIGIHDMDQIRFPLLYTAVPDSHKFVPLHSKDTMSMRAILEETPVGRKYGSILRGAQAMPVILDADGQVVSFPPIINSALTTLSEGAANLLVEITSVGKTYAEEMLSVVAAILQGAGFGLEQVHVSGHGNSTPRLSPRHMTLDPDLANRILGLDLGRQEIAAALRRSRLGASVRGRMVSCEVPAYRFDIFGPMDLVEEVALGYGVQNLEPALSAPGTFGSTSRLSAMARSADRMMTGLGFTEALNSGLTSSRVLYDATGRSSDSAILVMNSKSGEHTILRDALLPGLVENLSGNIHEPYPHRLYETGTVFLRGSPVREDLGLAGITAHGKASYTEMKSVVQSCMRMGFGVEIATDDAAHSIFEPGQSADILAGGRRIGMVGQIGSRVLHAHKIRVPAAGFELSLLDAVPEPSAAKPAGEPVSK